MNQMVEPLGLDRRQRRLVDRGDRARMTARKGDEVLIGLLHRRNPGTQTGDRALLEADHITHRQRV